MPAAVLHPGVPTDRFYHLVMKEKLWKSWSGDSFGIKYMTSKDSHGRPIESGPFEADIKGAAMSFRDRMVVRDTQSGTPVAVILSMMFSFERTFKIYTFCPNFDGQRPSQNQKHEGRALYEFAECKDKFMSIRTTLKTVIGDDYVTDAVGSTMSGTRELRVTRNGHVCAYMKTLNLGFMAGNKWELKIAPGIDPVLMVAFRAIMDEMNEDKRNGFVKTN